MSQRLNLKEIISGHYSEVYDMFAKELDLIQDVSLCLCYLLHFMPYEVNLGNNWIHTIDFLR